MLITFIVDTSASMNQRTNYSGMSLLDCAKAAIEHFVKIRSRDPATQRGDRYFLVTCEEGLGAIKVQLEAKLIYIFRLDGGNLLVYLCRKSKI